LQCRNDADLGFNINLDGGFRNPSVKMLQQRQGSFTVAFQRCGA
jgi:hypothetical protein